MIRLGDWLVELERPMSIQYPCGVKVVDPADAIGFEQELREHYAEGERRGREAALLEWSAAASAERDRLNAAHDGQMEALRHEAASALSCHLQDGLSMIRAEIEADVARVLRPFVQEACRQRAMREFSRLLSLRLENGGAELLALAIPAPYQELVGQLLTSSDARIAMSEADGVDLRASSPAGGFETRLAEWIALLKNGADELEAGPRE